jgi:AraC family L-rhamnose operon transcriptional activator RhaR
MFLWGKSVERLNRQAGLLQGERLTFHVHYWGAEQHLQANRTHKHSFHEICYVEAGTGAYEEPDQVYPLRQGVLFASKPGVVHQIRDVNELSLLFVAFEPDEKLSDPGELARYTMLMLQGHAWMDNQADSPIVRLWQSMMVPGDETSALPAAALPLLSHTLLASFPVLFGGDDGSGASTVRSNAEHTVRRAKQYIRDNLDGNLALPEVARQLNLSERHLSRLFASNILESYTEVVKRERIRAAEGLLLKSELPIKDIAERVGFSSVHYFTRIFAVVKGMPPAAFRDKKSIKLPSVHD